MQTKSKILNNSSMKKRKCLISELCIPVYIIQINVQIPGTSFSASFVSQNCFLSPYLSFCIRQEPCICFSSLIFTAFIYPLLFSSFHTATHLGLFQCKPVSTSTAFVFYLHLCALINKDKCLPSRWCCVRSIDLV